MCHSDLMRELAQLLRQLPEREQRLVLQLARGLAANHPNPVG